MQTDRIVKRALFKAPISKVWAAIGDARQFGAWFRMAIDGDFVAGTQVRGRVTYPGYEHLTAELFIERVDPPHLLSYRWHPYAVDPGVDYSQEPTTLVEFRLTEVGGGTEVVITESGFERIPEHRRAEAFRMNDGGWAEQIQNLERHVTSH
jgi:uncharacterized protein YndB with AHSA1/START domain